MYTGLKNVDLFVYVVTKLCDMCYIYGALQMVYYVGREVSKPVPSPTLHMLSAEAFCCIGCLLDEDDDDDWIRSGIIWSWNGGTVGRHL